MSVVLSGPVGERVEDPGCPGVPERVRGLGGVPAGRGVDGGVQGDGVEVFRGARIAELRQSPDQLQPPVPGGRAAPGPEAWGAARPGHPGTYVQYPGAPVLA